MVTGSDSPPAVSDHFRRIQSSLKDNAVLHPNTVGSQLPSAAWLSHSAPFFTPRGISTLLFCYIKIGYSYDSPENVATLASENTLIRHLLTINGIVENMNGVGSFLKIQNNVP